MQWLPGHQLTNRPYRIEKELGQGGFGITYKAIDLTLDIPVVIKIPNSKLQKDNNYQKYVTNFTREAKQLAQLGRNPHPHIVRVSSLFKEDNLPCIVMDFVPGQSLYNLVWSQGKLSEAKAVEYIKQVGSALVVCHQAGIVHRDVHPNNILIHTDHGKAILIDFGISGSTQTSRNTHSGNRAFAPWEQVAYWEGENSKTPQVDIYTLAASLYFLVTGQEPTECLARKYNNSELIEPKQLNPELSDEINQAILKGVEVSPENRPISMKAWLNNLLSISSATSQREPDSYQFSIVKQNFKEDKQVEDVLKRRNYIQESPKADPKPSKRQKRKIHTPPSVKQKNTSQHHTSDKAIETSHRANNKFFIENTQPIKRNNTDASVWKNSISVASKVHNTINKLYVMLTSIPNISIRLTPYGYVTAVALLSIFGILTVTIRNHFVNENTLIAMPKTAIASNNESIATLRIHSSDEARSITFSPDGNTLAYGIPYNDKVKLWNISARKRIATLASHLESVYSLALSSNGNTLAIGDLGDDIELWNISARKKITNLDHSETGESIAFSPDGRANAS